MLTIWQLLSEKEQEERKENWKQSRRQVEIGRTPKMAMFLNVVVYKWLEFIKKKNKTRVVSFSSTFETKNGMFCPSILY